MVITDRFVYVHMPKTGGTFVTSVLKTLHDRLTPRGIGGIARRLVGIEAPKCEILRSHTTYMEIASCRPGLKLLGTVRSPYDRYVSQYEFGWFRSHPEACGSVASILKRWPNFPDLSFEEFVRFSNSELIRLQNNNFSEDNAPGLQTAQFVYHYCRDPLMTFARIDDRSCAMQEFRKELSHVELIHTENVNTELVDFLVKNGYARESVDFILHQGKILPKEGGRSSDQKWQQYYTPELKQYVRRKERLLFDLFPEYDL